jgi:DNA-directed RNA polymerase subunit RPC12/RpoP
MQNKKQSLFKQSLQATTEETPLQNETPPVLWLCSNCSCTQTFGKNDLIKCKLCNHRIFYKQRNKNNPAMYVAI